MKRPKLKRFEMQLATYVLKQSKKGELKPSPYLFFPLQLKTEHFFHLIKSIYTDGNLRKKWVEII